jgi:hypothetical protein
MGASPKLSSRPTSMELPAPWMRRIAVGRIAEGLDAEVDPLA